MASSTPLHLTLELHRAVVPDDPYLPLDSNGLEHNAPPSNERYILRLGSGDVVPAGFHPDHVEQVMTDLEAFQSGVIPELALARLGSRLRAFLGDAWSTAERELEIATQAGQPVVITFVSGAGELYELPWELMRVGSSGSPLIHLNHCLLRYRWPRISPTPCFQEPRLEGGRIVFAWAGAGAFRVPHREHADAIRAASAAAGLSYDASRDELPDASMDEIEQAILAARSAGQVIGVLHLLCHGAPLEPGNQSEGFGLRWRGRSGYVSVSPRELHRRLAPLSDTVRSIVLCACYGASSGTPGSPLGSVAQQLHLAGIEAVVASRIALTRAGSVELTRALYQALLVGTSGASGAKPPHALEDALLVARARLLEQGARLAEGGRGATLDPLALQLFTCNEESTRPIIFRPYRGLEAFDRPHRHFFFGREQEASALLHLVMQGLDAAQPRFVVVEGASGCGKSSIVRAGVLPALSATGLWDVCVMRPGEVSGPSVEADPLSVLEERLSQTGTSGGALSSQLLPSAAHALEENAAHPENPMVEARPNRLLVIDQFEELFSHVRNERVRTAFVHALWRRARQFDTQPKTTVVILVRNDYLGQCGDLTLDETGIRLDALLEESGRHHVLIRQLDPTRWREAIEAPARATGMRFEPGLVDALISDLVRQPGAVPLLQFALDRLWRQRSQVSGKSLLTSLAYERMGRLKGALAGTADELYDALPPAQREVAEALLVDLVDFREEATLATRRWVAVSRLSPAQQPGQDDLNAVLNRFVEARLLVRDSSLGEQPTVSIAHEALIREWPTLQAWLVRQQDFLRLRRHIEDPAKIWSSRASALERERALGHHAGDGLEIVRSLKTRWWSRLGQDQQGYVDACLERSASNERRRRQVAFVLTLLTVASLCLAAAVYVQNQAASAARDDALRQRDRARVATVETFVKAMKYEDPTLAALALLEIAPGNSGADWSQDALETVKQPLSAAIFRGHEQAVLSARFSPDGKRVATASWDGTARLWPADGLGDALVLRGHRDAVVAVAFSPDGMRLVTASRDGTARIWSSATGEVLHVLEGHTDKLNDVSFSADGTNVLTVSWDGTARVWDAERANTLITLGDPRDSSIQNAHRGHVRMASFSPDGQQVLTLDGSDNGQQGTLRVWSLEEGMEPLVLKSAGLSLYSATFSPTGDRVAAVSLEGKALVWKLNHPEPPLPLNVQGEFFSSAVFSPDGLRLGIASLSGTAQLADAQGDDPPKSLEQPERRVLALTFSPAGEWIATAQADGTARIWDATGGDTPRVLRGHKGRVRSVDFSPDGKWLLTSSDDATARLWPVEGSTAPAVLTLDSQPVPRDLTLDSKPKPRDARFFPAGAHVAALDSDGTVHVWKLSEHLASWAEVTPLGTHSVSSLNALQLSPAGGAVLGIGEDEKVHITPISAAGSMEEGAAFGAGIRQATFAADGQGVLTVDSTGTISLWNPGGSVIWAAKTNRSIRSAQLSQKGKYLGILLADGTLHVTPLGAEAGRKTGITPAIRFDAGLDPEALLPKSPRGDRDVDLSQPTLGLDGAWILLADSKRCVWRLPVDGQAPPRQVACHLDTVKAISESPDGRWIATASGDTAYVWRTNGDAQPLRLQGHTFLLNSVRFSPDGERMVTTSEDGTLRIWPIGEALLRRMLTSATTATLPYLTRVHSLGESSQEACRLVEAQERSRGRTPPSCP